MKHNCKEEKDGKRMATREEVAYVVCNSLLELCERSKTSPSETVKIFADVSSAIARRAGAFFKICENDAYDDDIDELREYCESKGIGNFLTKDETNDKTATENISVATKSNKKRFYTINKKNDNEIKS